MQLSNQKRVSVEPSAFEYFIAFFFRCPISWREMLVNIFLCFQKNMQLKLKSVESRQNDMAEQSNRENMRLRDRIRQLEDQITTMSNEMGDMERNRALDWTDVCLLDQQFNTN